MRTRRRIWSGALAVVVALAAAGAAVRWWLDHRYIETTDDAYVAGEIVRVSPRIAGYVSEVAATDNQRVRAGDVLVRIDPRDHRARFERATADVAAAVAAIADIEANRRLQDAVTEQQRADIAAAEAELARARLDLDRYRSLSRSAFTPRQRLEQAEADYNKALAAQQKAVAALAAAQRRLDVLTAERAAAEAALAQAQSSLELARIDLDATVIRAPRDGTVGNRTVRAGAYVRPGSELLAIVPSRGLWVEANFKETQIAQMRPGDPVTLTVDAAPGVRFTAAVDSLAPATGAEFSLLPPQNATGNFTKIVQRLPVRIALTGGDDTLGLLRPGLSVVVHVDTRRDEAERLQAQR